MSVQEVQDRIRHAYANGFRAGRETVRTDKRSYRRGYLTGYNAARHGRPQAPDGAGFGRPRKETAL